MFRLLLLICCCAPTLTWAADEPPQAVVTLVDGRVVTGTVDDATDTVDLWIRRGDDRVLLATSYRWQEVASVELDGEAWTPDEIVGLLSRVSKPWPRYALFEQEEKLQVERPSVEVRQQATSASFVARLANWDADVEPDGYLVELTVYDQFGRPMPVRGSVRARLVGERTTSYLVPGEPVELERWSETLEQSQFANGPAVLRLPFRQIRPEHQTEIAPGALLELEVGAFGHGQMAASAAVPTRQFNPVRDRFEQRTDNRFAPGERHEPWSHE